MNIQFNGNNTSEFDIEFSMRTNLSQRHFVPQAINKLRDLRAMHLRPPYIHFLPSRQQV